MIHIDCGRQNHTLKMVDNVTIGKETNACVQAESSKFASLSFDQGFQIVIPPTSPASVPEPIGTPSDGILHRSRSDCCLLHQCNSKTFIINEMHGYIWSARNYTIGTTLVSLPIQVPRGEGPPCHLGRQRKWIIVSPSINQSHDFHLHNTVLGWLGCISEQNWPQFDKF